MFDIGFAELILISVVGLLVIGPERLPGALRTGSLWLNRIRRGFNDIKREVQQEMHNDSVMQDLRKTGEQIKNQTERLGQQIGDTTPSAGPPASGDPQTTDSPAPPQEKSDP